MKELIMVKYNNEKVAEIGKGEQPAKQYIDGV